MAKQKKKRNKKYSGADAAVTRPSITRVEAVHRNAASQWWVDHQRIAKPVLVVVAIILGILWSVAELVRMIANS